MKNLKVQKFIEKAKTKFGEKFDYSKVTYINNQEVDKITIICPEHGEFRTTPRVFLKSKFGCKLCANKIKGENQRKNKNIIANTVKIEIPHVKNPVVVDNDKIIATVYCFINKINNKLYIGETVKSDFKIRFNEHYCKSKSINNYFYHAIRKYGWDSFDKIILFQSKEILDNTPENKKILDNIANEKEKYYINLYDTTNHIKGYNLTSGGDGVSGYKFSEETKAKMSADRSGKNHWNYGKTNGKASKAIYQYSINGEFLKEWPSMAEITRELGYAGSNISRCCSGKSISYKNFIWILKNNHSKELIEDLVFKNTHKFNQKDIFVYDCIAQEYMQFNTLSKFARFIDMKNNTIQKACTKGSKIKKRYYCAYSTDALETYIKKF